LPKRSLNYAKGRALEYECKKVLEGMGFFVIRSAGSHSPADLCALKNGHILLVQVQKESHLPRQKEEALKAVCRKAGAIGYFAHKRRGSWFFWRVYPEMPTAPIPRLNALCRGAEPPLQPPMLNGD